MKYVILLLMCCGCASFKTVQTDISTSENEQRTIITKTTARTFFDSKSKLADLKTTQTDGTQDTEVGSLTQESTSEAISATVEAATRGAVRGAINAVTPTP